MPVLRLLTPDARRVVREFPLTAVETAIGRSKESDVVLVDESVSRRHARLTITSRGYELADQGSANGLWIRDQHVGGGIVAAGELFRVGDCVMQVVEEGSPAPVPAPEWAHARASLPPRQGSRAGLWAALLLALVAGGGCAAGLALYALRGAWLPLLGASSPSSSVASSSPGGTAAPAAETPCPPAVSELCAWSLPGATPGACPAGFCFDGGSQSTSACRQREIVPNAHRDDAMDVVCDDGFTAERDRCTKAVARCTKP
jgi:Inner membrane component of T3SS, cytoplasmic domain